MILFLTGAILIGCALVPALACFARLIVWMWEEDKSAVLTMLAVVAFIAGSFLIGAGMDQMGWT